MTEFLRAHNMNTQVLLKKGGSEDLSVKVFRNGRAIEQLTSTSAQLHESGYDLIVDRTFELL